MARHRQLHPTCFDLLFGSTAVHTFCYQPQESTCVLVQANCSKPLDTDMGEFVEKFEWQTRFLVWNDNAIEKLFYYSTVL